MSEDEVRRAARELLSTAFTSLAEQDVIPRPRWDAYMRVGRDYWGPDLMFDPAFQEFERVLSTVYPHRFPDHIRPHDEYQEFPNSFAFGLIEATVARITTNGEAFDVTSSIVESCLDELIRSLDEENMEVACLWVVTHLTTTDGSSETLDDITVTPEAARRDVAHRIAEVIPGARALLGNETPFVHDPPMSVVEIRGRNSHPHRELSSLRSRLDTFVLLLRLLYGCTIQPRYEVGGSTGLQRSVGAQSTMFKSSESLIRRTHRLAPEHLVVMSKFKSLLDEVSTDQPDMAVTSLGMALRKFASPYLGEPWSEQIVDLCTALEAILSGTDKDDISLRLRIRAAALLAAPNDPARKIFEDVGLLYGMRSTLVHGGSLAIRKVKRDIERLSTVGSETREGVRVAQAVDRLQDLVRRAILARIALASSDAPLWPLTGSVGVDAALADDAERVRWRSAWRKRMVQIGADTSVDRASTAVDFLSDDPT